MRRRDAVVLLGAVALLGSITEGLRSVPGAGPIVVAPLFLAVVVGSATLARLRVAIAASLLAALALDFFFVRPIGRFTIADPRDSLTLAGFLAVAIAASRLSARARLRAQAADRGERARSSPPRSA